MKRKLRLRYIYSFYSGDELCDTAPIDEEFEIERGMRFKLHLMEEGDILVSDVSSDFIGEFAVLTYPNKENLIVRKGEECEIYYDEEYDSMGDVNHNVYEGTVTIVKE